MVLSNAGVPRAVWTGSTNWSTTGLCTQVNNGLLIDNKAVAKLYRQQWEALKDASPPKLDPAGFPPALVTSNDKSHAFSIGATKLEIWFTRTSDGRDMDALRKLIAGAKDSILFRVHAGKKTDCTHSPASEPTRKTYVRGVVSTLGTAPGDTDRNVLDIRLVSSAQNFKPDHYTVIQPQGVDVDRAGSQRSRARNFVAIGHAIVHSKVLVIDPLSSNRSW